MLDATRPGWVTALVILFSLVMVLLLARGLRRDRQHRDRGDTGRDR